MTWDAERQREYMRAYYRANRERWKEYSRRTKETETEEDRERKRQSKRAYRARRPDVGIKSSRRWYEANRERALETRRRWRETNGERRREHRATMAHGITRIIRDWMYESQDRACAGCHTPMPDAALEIDHDHACCPGERSCGRCVRGLVCRSCNSRDVLAAVFAKRFGEEGVA
jgi:hypothetical protein